MINDTILMKPISKLITLSLGILLAGCSGKEAPSTTDELSLHFNDQGTFKVIQMTDTHICWENQEEYAKAVNEACSILDIEKPDLVVFTGDVVTGAGADSAWVNYLKLLDDRNIPFVITYGNHDREQELTERELADVVMSHPMNLNTAKSGWLDDIAVEIKSSKGDEVAALLYCMDSGDYSMNERVGSHYGWFRWDQVEWYRKTSFEYTNAHGGVPYPAFSFFHIPLLEFGESFKTGKVVSGVREEDECPGYLNSGLFSAFVECGDVHGVFCGHDHVNDYVVQKDDVYLIYGRFSGRNTTYHNLPFGFRVIELTEGDYGLRTWIREEDGGIVQIDTLKVEADYTLRKAVEAKGKEHGLTRTEYSGEFNAPEDILAGTEVKTEVVASPFIPRKSHPESHGYLLSGKLYVPESGVWFFHMTSRGVTSIQVDDWTISGTTLFQGRVNLEKGYHDLKVLMADKADHQERLRVQWRRLDCAKYQDIPEENLFIE